MHRLPGGHGCHLNNLLATDAGGALSFPTLPTQVKRTRLPRSLSSKTQEEQSGLAGGLAWSQTRGSGLEPAS